MSTNHKPATPLPWGVGDSGIVSDDNAQEVCAPMGIDQREMLTDAAYIAHAANAYPELVATVMNLRDHLSELRRLTGATAGRFGDALDRAENLLLELGEAE